MEKLFHIPHSSTFIPEKYIGEYIISKEQLENDAFLLCDIRTDEMIEGVVFPYSRLFCDVERINSDEEIMNKVGMGILYTKNHNLETIRENPSQDIIDYYNEHHKKLNDIVKEKLEKTNEILFIDLHSFSEIALPYEFDKNKNRPDICLGINERFNKYLLEKIIYIVEDFDFTYDINEPFIGSLTPSNYINDERVHSIMIEVNKKIYDTDAKFQKIKKLLKCVKEI